MFLSLPLAICVFVLLGADDVIVDVVYSFPLSLLLLHCPISGFGVSIY
jgi:hypothetical protein